jgi:chromosome condensin MukBEF complex kleisin-like MukF subunit
MRIQPEAVGHDLTKFRSVKRRPDVVANYQCARLGVGFVDCYISSRTGERSTLTVRLSFVQAQAREDNNHYGTCDINSRQVGGPLMSSVERTREDKQASRDSMHRSTREQPPNER